MSDKTTNWILKLTDMVSGPMTRISSVTGSASSKFSKLNDTCNKLGAIGSGATRSLGAGVGRTTGLVEGLNQRLDRLRTKQIQAFDTRHVAIYNRMIESTQREVDKLNRMGTSSKGAASGIGIASMLGIGGMGMKAGIVGAGIAAVAMTGAALKTVAETTAKYEQIGVGFEVLLGSKSKSDKMVGDLIAYANKSPLRSEDVFQSTQTLLGFGYAAEKILPAEKMLGDISMGNAEKFQGLSLAFAQTQAAGKLMGQDLLQYISQGFNPLQEISKMTGRSMAQLRDDMEKGLISAQMVEKAFQVATSAGGRFYDMANKQSETLGGRWSTLADSADMLSLALGERLKPAFSGVLDASSSVVNKLTEFVKVPVTEKIQNERIQVNALATALFNAKLPMEKRNELYDKLLLIQPDILKGINKESLSYETLRGNLEAYNNEMMRKFVVAGQEDAVTKLSKKTADSYVDMFEQSKTLYEDMNSALVGLPPEKQTLGYKIIFNNKLSDVQKASAVSDLAGMTSYGSNMQPNVLEKDLSKFKRYESIYLAANAASQKGLLKLTELQNRMMQETGNLYVAPKDPPNPADPKTPSVSDALNNSLNSKGINQDNITTSGGGSMSGSGGSGKSVTMTLTVNQYATINGNNEADLKKLKNELVSIIVDAAGDAAATL